MSHRRRMLALLLLLGLAPSLLAQKKGKEAPPPATQADIDRAIELGSRWLIRAQEVDGGWKGPHPVEYPAGMTGLALYALLKTGLPPEHRVVRKGLAFMNSQPCEKTYAVGTNLLVYAALPKEMRNPKRIRRLTELLVDTLGLHGWRYNRPTSNVFDLSNGQYAVLGLRAAVGMGEKVPVNTWKRAGKIFIKLQESYGGWGYRPNEKWVDAGMTAAGIFCCIVCRDQLEANKDQVGLQRELRGRIARGLSWYADNWAVDKNLILPESKDPRNRWRYHYLYGLERVGALTGLDLIGGHNWYDAGAARLVKDQRKGGSWGTAYGEEDVNTSLALLFLARGTRSTAVRTRKRTAAEGDAAETFVIRTNGENPALAWITRLEKKVRERLDGGQKVTALVWDVDGAEIDRVVIEGPLDVRNEALFLSHRFEANGEHTIGARLVFATAEGDDAGEETSTPASLWIDDIEEPGDREAIADIGKNKLEKVVVTTKASSKLNDKSNAPHAVDGHHSTSWICADDDTQSWIELELSKGVRASVLKLVGTHKYTGNDDDWARPKEIEVVINGRKRIPVTLPDDVRRKHSIPLPKLRVRRIRVEIKSLYPGKKKATRVGFKELELHDARR